MVRWTIVLPSWILGALLLQPSTVRAQTVEFTLPVSVDRIRAALQEPPPVLRIPEAATEVPTFRVEVLQQLPVLFFDDEPPFDPTYGLPSVGQLLVGGIGKIRSAAVDYKHRRSKRRAREEVQDALAAFCAVHECPASDSSK